MKQHIPKNYSRNEWVFLLILSNLHEEYYKQPSRL